MCWWSLKKALTGEKGRDDVPLDPASPDYRWQELFSQFLDGIPVRTLNLEGLLRTKQSARDKDIADQTILERALETIRNRQK